MSVLSCAVCVRANQLGRINQNAIGLPCQSKEKPRKALHSLAEVTSAAHSLQLHSSSPRQYFRTTSGQIASAQVTRTNTQMPGEAWRRKQTRRGLTYRKTMVQLFRQSMSLVYPSSNLIRSVFHSNTLQLPNKVCIGTSIKVRLVSNPFIRSVSVSGAFICQAHFLHLPNKSAASARTRPCPSSV